MKGTNKQETEALSITYDNNSSNHDQEKDQDEKNLINDIERDSNDNTLSHSIKTNNNHMEQKKQIVAPTKLETLVNVMARTYPGRASNAPILDLFQTLLYLGKDGYKKLLQKRQKEMVPYFKQELEKVASKHGERVLSSPSNTISYAVSLTFPLIENNNFSTINHQSVSRSITDFGSMLFLRSVSGCRVIDVSRHLGENYYYQDPNLGKNMNQTTINTEEKSDNPYEVECLENDLSQEENDEVGEFVHRVKPKTINGVSFESFGASIDIYPTSYFTAASALGMEKEEVDTFIHRLDHVLGSWKAKQAKKRKGKIESI